MLRGGLRGTPLLDYKTVMDYNDARVRILEQGTHAEREQLWTEVEAYMRKHHHRPLLERQRRARAEYQACSMRDGSSRDFASFLAEFRKCVKNLERARLEKPPEELKVDFLEKVTEECATYLMLTPYRDAVTGETHPVRSVEEAQSMAREFFVIKEPQRQFHLEEAKTTIQTGAGGAKGAGKRDAGKKGDPGPRNCSTCGGVGHSPWCCPNTAAAKNGTVNGVCKLCGGKGHIARDHTGVVAPAEQQAWQQGGGGGKKGDGKKGGQ